MLKNYTEVVVAEVLDEVIDSYSKDHPLACFCTRCREDIMALALNQLSPRYLVRDEGYIYTHVAFDKVGGKSEVIAAVMRGLERVQKSPRHGKDLQGK